MTDDRAGGDAPPPKSRRRRAKPPVLELAATEIGGAQGADAHASDREPSARARRSWREWLKSIDRDILLSPAALAIGAGTLAGAMVAILVVLLFESGGDPRVSRLASEIAALNARIETLARPGAPGIDPAALATLGERIDRLSGALAESERRLAGIESRPAAPAPDFVPLANRIGVLEGMLETLRRELGDLRRLAEQRPVARSADVTNSTIAAEIVTLGILRDAVEAGTPFVAELAAVRKLLGERAAPLAALDQAASEGLPTTATLARRFSELIPALTRASDPQGNFLDRLVGSAGRLVEIRRIGEPSGADLSAVAARMETRLQRGDLAGALDEAASVPALAQGPAAPWLTVAKMRRDAEASLKTLIAASLAALQSERSR